MHDPLDITRGGRELLDELRPLWLALRTHHNEIAPELGAVRSDAETWRRRRAAYERWLEDERSFVLLARRSGRAVGYAFVRAEEIGREGFAPAFAVLRDTTTTTREGGSRRRRS